jgi:hypothetical protein
MKDEELATAWNALQSRVERTTTALADTQRRLDRSEMETHRNRLGQQPVWEISLAALTLLFVGSFAANHLRELLDRPLAAIPAAVLGALAIVQIHLGVRHLIVASGLDLGRPILETQEKLAELRKLRVRVTQWIFAAALPVWVVFPLLLGQAVFGVEFVFKVSPAWIVANVLFGLAMVPVIDWAMKRSQFATSLQDGLAGRELLAAGAFLREIRSFRAEA